MSVETKTLRLFFALWPDEAVRASLSRTIESLKQTTTAKWGRPENLHITLAFLGQVSEDRLPLINRVADGVIGQPFELGLDRIEFWRRSGIICLSSVNTPEALKNLANSLIARLAETGFAMENRPYRAHLTLARKGRSGCISQVLSDPINWSVSSFSLIESQIYRAGSLYVVRKSWNLQGLQAIPEGSSVR
ncbi:RNA 2',3'-cyclic phosphodiesterase [Methylocaldum sp.]|uniref:RNA 2',3'-cyclic phosphodiesterase n=1 Tax=Methylocaldum sp. TaxID=1969727 RepID=UPI002D3423EE|nr:RNA 2',3'-cyclic phosphodiesterase [Methylocaldum sp.]HYE36974.1 RNA 2',3'-cyclic phosphodiesterase [Methylocaldum sp.]